MSRATKRAATLVLLMFMLNLYQWRDTAIGISTGLQAKHFNSSSWQQLDEFLRSYPDSAGARFVHLLREHMHYSPDSEATRLDSCLATLRGTQDEATISNCYSGISMDKLANANSKNVSLPLDVGVSVYDMARYPGRQEKIPSLGTAVSCLPLLLAGASVVQDSVVLELGPYFGFSSKCIVVGMSANGFRQGSFFAFDTFDGVRNYDSIQRSSAHRWILKEFPFYTRKNSSFLFLWEMAVKQVYPPAIGRAAYINKQSVNRRTLNSTSVDFISVDSAKSIQQVQSQLAGLKTLKAGTILFLLDFEYVYTQIQAVYGCLRHTGLLIPVYTAWCGRENWAFVVARDFSFSQPDIAKCRKFREWKKYQERSYYWIDQDLHMLSSLAKDNKSGKNMKDRIDCMTTALRFNVDRA